MRQLFSILTVTLGVMFLFGCERNGTQDSGKPSGESTEKNQHAHADGSTHDDHAEEPAADGDDHTHDETSIGKVMIGETEVELAQGHGKVTAGAEGHLVVKLPYNDKGTTVVRAWLGTDDRTLSVVGKGEYAPSHDDYDVHAVAPDPLPEDVMWWIEIEKPDGTKTLGSAKPLR